MATETCQCFYRVAMLSKPDPGRGEFNKFKKLVENKLLPTIKAIEFHEQGIPLREESLELIQLAITILTNGNKERSYRVKGLDALSKEEKMRHRTCKETEPILFAIQRFELNFFANKQITCNKIINPPNEKETDAAIESILRSITQSALPSEQAQASSPTELAEPSQPFQQSQSSLPTQQIEPTAPSQPTEPTEPTEPTQQTPQQIQQTQPAQSAQSELQPSAQIINQPIAQLSTQPTAQTDQPLQPTQPTQLTKPTTQPSQSNEPTQSKTSKRKRKTDSNRKNAKKHKEAYDQNDTNHLELVPYEPYSSTSLDDTLPLTPCRNIDRPPIKLTISTKNKSDLKELGNKYGMSMSPNTETDSDEEKARMVNYLRALADKIEESITLKNPEPTSNSNSKTAVISHQTRKGQLKLRITKKIITANQSVKQTSFEMSLEEAMEKYRTEVKTYFNHLETNVPKSFNSLIKTYEKQLITIL